MLGLNFSVTTQFLCGNTAAAAAQNSTLVSLAEEKGASTWKAGGRLNEGALLAMTGRAAEAVELLTVAIADYRATGTTLFAPFFTLFLARAHAEIGQFGEARRCIEEAIDEMETRHLGWCQAEIYRAAGEIEFVSAESDAAKAEVYFDRALTVARDQSARSWELRTVMSLAKLLRGQGKRDEAHDLLAPIYGWFTEGSNTLDLKEAKALLDELHA
jgi:predicted ATPase